MWLQVCSLVEDPMSLPFTIAIGDDPPVAFNPIPFCNAVLICHDFSASEQESLLDPIVRGAAVRSNILPLVCKNVDKLPLHLLFWKEFRQSKNRYRVKHDAVRQLYIYTSM